VEFSSDTDAHSITLMFKDKIEPDPHFIISTDYADWAFH